MNGNAKITRTTLGYEDHGILTCFLHLEQPGTGQGFGGYRLDAPKRKWSWACGFWVQRILETVGVSEWGDLAGKHVRVKGEELGDIEGIGHITEERWFFPKRELAELDLQKHLANNQ